MNKVIKYKIYYLLSNRLITILTIILFLALNFNAIVNSGVLFSGGEDFNVALKYELLFNNYMIIASLHGLIFSIFLGASMIGPDMQTGNMYILMSSYPSRVKYYLGTYLAVLFYLLSIHFALLLNIFVLFFVFEVQFVFTDIIICFRHIVLNSVVVLTVTGFASIFMKGFQSVIAGFLAYAYYNIYTFNEIPFINTSFLFDATRYRDILSNFLPIINVLAPSYTEEHVLIFYQIHPIIPNISVYQCVFILFTLWISCIVFKRKDL